MKDKSKKGKSLKISSKKTKKQQSNNLKKLNIDDDKLNKLFTITNNIQQTLIKYQYITKQIQLHKLNTVDNIKTYHYSNLDTIHKEFDKIFKKNNDIIDKYNISDNDIKIITHLVENYARGVSAYVMQNYNLSELLAPKVSNGFIKLWEIYNTLNIIPNKKKIKVFHLAEAPGQWINCTHYFILTKRSKVEEYDWKATSLNPKNKENIEKYGSNIFGHRDEYGLLKKYKNRWIWGVDDTGDITKIDNLKWYRDYSKKWEKDSGKIDLVLGDGGIQSEDIIVNQKLEYAQLFMVLATASYGSNCVIKHFLPYVSTIPESFESGGYFSNLIYLYYLMFETVILTKPLTSSPISGEFYVVGKSFRGISNENFEKIINTLENFKPNQCIFPQNELPDEFIKQINEFNKTILQLNIKSVTMKIEYLQCFSKDNKIKEELNCNKYINSKYYNIIKNQKFKEWVKVFKFE